MQEFGLSKQIKHRGFASLVFYELNRWIFIVSIIAFFFAFSIIICYLIFRFEVSIEFSAILFNMGVFGTIGSLASMALANFVRCLSCQQKALVFVTTGDDEYMTQPWRRSCGRRGHLVK